MKKMHNTLKPSTNIVMILLWGALAGFATFISAPHSFLVVIVGLILGVSGGVMQWLAFTESKEKFLTASTMLEVRKELKETKWGKRYIPFLWLGNLVIVVLVVIIGKGNLFILIMAGYFSLMFARELVTLKPTFELAQYYRGSLE